MHWFIRLLCLGWLGSVCTLAAADDPREQFKQVLEELKQTKELVKQGKHAEALEKYESMYEEAALEEGGSSVVRRSSTLRDWDALGKRYPPARDALLSLRERTIKLLLETGGTFASFQEAKTLNRLFDREPQTLELFEQICKAHPEQGARYWHAIRDQALAAERFDLATKYMPDLELEFVKTKTQHELMTAMGKRRPGGAQMQKFLDDRIAVGTCQLIQVGLKTGQPEVAVKLQKQALAVLDDPRIREAIPQAPAAAEKSEPAANAPAESSREENAPAKNEQK